MKTLSELQSVFFHSIINNSDELNAEITHHGELNAAERLAIYVNGYRLRLIEALQDSFPALHTLMGDADYEDLCLNYIDQFPSTHFSVRHFGNSLADFLLARHQGDKADLLHEMAMFEWNLRAAFDAKDQVPLSLQDFSELAAEDWAELKFQLHASLSTLYLQWNVPALWMAIEQAAELETEQATEQDAKQQAPQQSQKPVCWLIWRPVLETQFRSVNEDEAKGLQMLQQGKSFAQMCDVMSESDSPELAATQAASYLGRWIEEGLLVSFSQ